MELRLAELIGALSVAVDLGMSQPAEDGLRSCLVALELGAALGFDESALETTYYVALLRLVGCTSTLHQEVDIFGQEVGELPGIRAVDHKATTIMAFIARTYAADQPPLARIGRVASAFARAAPLAGGSAAHCEVAERLAERLGLGTAIQHALTHVFERWDGAGRPRGLKGEAIDSAARVVSFASDVVVFHELGGMEAARVMVRERAGHKHDPRIAEVFVQHANALGACLADGAPWERVLAAEPGARPSLTPSQADRAIRAMGDFADLKEPCLSGHSSGVAELAVAAAERCGLGAGEITTLRHAALLHDIGRTGVTTAIWGKPGPLTEGEWERVRLHPYYTERVLARARALAPAAAIASLHHERLDGSGYHRGLPGQMQPQAARLLAAADAYHAMREPRPHRAALPPEQAAEELRREARAGRLCPDAVAGVLGAAGHRAEPARRERPAGLSEREVEVLRLLARGLSNKQIAGRLVVSERTVHHHVEHIYDKIDVKTRAGATLFAIQHDLVHPLPQDS